jgi:hypothetical protein
MTRSISTDEMMSMIIGSGSIGTVGTGSSDRPVEPGMLFDTPARMHVHRIPQFEESTTFNVPVSVSVIVAVLKGVWVRDTAFCFVMLRFRFLHLIACALGPVSIGYPRQGKPCNFQA